MGFSAPSLSQRGSSSHYVSSFADTNDNVNTKLPFDANNFKSSDPEVNRLAKARGITIDQARDYEINLLNKKIKEYEHPTDKIDL